MAGHLAAAGHSLRVYNRSPEKAQRWCREHRGEWVAQIPELVADQAALISCVGNDQDLRDLCLGPQGAYAAMKNGSIHIDHTTSSATVARELAQAAAARGIGFMDAPVSGGEAGAQHGVLTIMLGGQAEDYRRAAPLLDCYARSHDLLGPAGHGQLGKMVNQICQAGLLQGLAEGLRFGELAGLPMDRLLALLGNGASASWQMQNRSASMLAREFDFGFAIDWMRKDLGIVAEQAGTLQLELPVMAQVARFFDELSAAGDGRSDTSALIKRLSR